MVCFPDLWPTNLALITIIEIDRWNLDTKNVKNKRFFFGLHRSFERVDVMKGCDRYKPYFKTRCFSRQTERKEKEFNFKCGFEPKRSTSVTRLYIQLTQKNDTSNLIPLYYCLFRYNMFQIYCPLGPYLEKFCSDKML